MRWLFSIVAGLMLMFSATPAIAVASTKNKITPGLCAGVDLSFTEKGSKCKSDNSASKQFNKIIRTIINLLSLLVGIVAVIMIIVGGFRYITSGGSDTSVVSAKNTILYAIIGLVIVAMAQVIVRFVLSKIVNA